jgi:hypothetical protein
MALGDFGPALVGTGAFQAAELKEFAAPANS